MSIARHGSGIRAVSRALASQIHPVFMLPPLASAAFGATLAGTITFGLLAIHLGAVFFALYTAHVTDGYVDFHVRGEDDDHPLTVLGCRVARTGSTLAFFACLAALWLMVDWVAALVTLPGWLVAVTHAPYLDTHPVGATAGYPVGIGFALVGGYYVQTGAFHPTVLALAVVFVIVLSGIKIVDDAQDYTYDRSVDKRTVAVVVGYERAHVAAYALMAVGMGAVIAFAAVMPGIPPSATLASVAFAAVAGVARRANPTLATMLLVRGSYVFLAFLVGALWFQPLQ